MAAEMDCSASAHWDRVYTEKETPTLGWYEAAPETTLALFEACHLPVAAPILLAGVGTSTLVEHLLDLGYQRLIAVDLSAVALHKLQQRLGPRAARVQWVVDDLSAPRHVGAEIGQIALWQDRAVLHFLRSETAREAYRQTLLTLLKPGGHALIACFAPGTAERCSGLPIRPYAAADLAAWLGPAFELKTHLLQTHVMPSGGRREFTHALFQRHA